MDDPRIARLEREVEALGRRLAALEHPATPSQPSLGQVSATRPEPGADPVARHASAPSTAVSLGERLRVPAGEALEDLLGGRVLAWVGGLAVLLGIAFLFAVAISHGWIGEPARVGLAAVGSSALLAFGVWLHERKARTDAALAAVASGGAGLFVTLTVATQLYALLPAVAGMALALLVGAIVTALAVRWESRGIAALGILGAIAAPLLVGAGHGAEAIGILLVALAAAGGVLLWQRWDWLAFAAFALSAPQWIAYLFDGASLAAAIAALVAYGALGVALAVGHDVRVRAESLRLAPAFLLALNAVSVAVAGWFALTALGGPAIGKAWLVALAVGHLTVGLAGTRLARVSRDLALLSLALGIVIADVAFALTADGVVLALGWTATTVGFAALLRHVRATGHDAALAGSGLGAHLALALLTTLMVDDPLELVTRGGTPSIASAASVAALAAGCLLSARLTAERRPELGTLLDALGLMAVALLSALALDGLALVLAWSAEVVALARIAGRAHSKVAGCGAVGFLALAGIHALTFEAPPVSLVTGLAEPLAALVAVGAVAGAALLASEPLRGVDGRLPTALKATTGVALLYLASGLVVTPFETSAVDTTLLSAHQQGQMVLSVFWALVGLGTLLIGLRRDSQALRLAALALLGVTVAKVFLVDLATLTSLYRVVSLVALGLLLLVGAYVWQRLRPPPLPDLREAPEGLR